MKEKIIKWILITALVAGNTAILGNRMLRMYNAISDKLDTIPSEIVLVTPTPEVIYKEVEVVKTETVVEEVTPCITAHYYKDPIRPLEINTDIDHFFIYQYDDRDMIIDYVGRYVYFDIQSIEDMRAKYSDGRETGAEIVWSFADDICFIKGYRLYGDMALIIYVPREDIWFMQDLEEVADDIYDSLVISLG